VCRGFLDRSNRHRRPGDKRDTAAGGGDPQGLGGKIAIRNIFKQQAFKLGRRKNRQDDPRQAGFDGILPLHASFGAAGMAPGRHRPRRVAATARSSSATVLIRAKI
jgi:hypothetical protein